MSMQERLTLRNLYLYLVCLITLIIAIFAAVSVIRGAVELAYPDPGYGYGYGPPKEGVDPESQRIARESQQRQSILGLVGSGSLLLITGPLYVYHWRRVQAERPPRGREAAAAPPAPAPAPAPTE